MSYPEVGISSRRDPKSRSEDRLAMDIAVSSLDVSCSRDVAGRECYVMWTVPSGTDGLVWQQSGTAVISVVPWQRRGQRI